MPVVSVSRYQRVCGRLQPVGSAYPRVPATVANVSDTSLKRRSCRRDSSRLVMLMMSCRALCGKRTRLTAPSQSARASCACLKVLPNADSPPVPAVEVQVHPVLREELIDAALDVPEVIVVAGDHAPEPHSRKPGGQAARDPGITVVVVQIDDVQGPGSERIGDDDGIADMQLVGVLDPEQARVDRAFLLWVGLDEIEVETRPLVEADPRIDPAGHPDFHAPGGPATTHPLRHVKGRPHQRSRSR